MLILSIPLLVAIGAAYALQGREVRGLLVMLTANVAVGLGAAASTRWGWLAFSLAMDGLVLLGIAVARNEPEPAPEERDPDWCITHKKLEPKEDR